MNYPEIISDVIRAAVQAGDFIAAESGKITQDVIETKGLHDHVTYVDKTSEKLLVELLSSILPEAGFIVEEGTSTKKGEVYNWIVDPLDGTSNYIHKFGPYAVSIALMRENEIILGVVHEVVSGETFYAWEGSEAFCNGLEIKVSSTDNLSDAMIATGFPYNEYTRLEKHVATLTHFLKTSRGMRRLGSAATDLCYVACGRFDAFWEYNLSAWDCAAGALIVKQAGGRVADFSGGENYLFGKEMMASNAGIADAFFAVVKENFA